MYSRPKERTFTVPQNYSGNAFSDIREAEYHEPEAAEPDIPPLQEPTAEPIAEQSAAEPKRFLPISIGTDELILIGIALLLFQSDSNDGIIPLLLAILFLG
jgi:hypothetical protein